MIVILGNCIALAEHTLIPEITGIPDATTKIDHSIKNKKWRNSLVNWYLRNFKNNETIQSSQLVRLALFEKENLEKQLAWPSFIQNCKNLSTYGSTFLGMLSNLKNFCIENGKPKFVAILDYPRANRSCVVNHAGKKYVVESSYFFTDKNQIQVPKEAYKIFLAKRKKQETYGETFQIKKKEKSFKTLIRYCETENITFRIFMFYEQNKEFLNQYDVIDCTHFEKQYRNKEGFQRCDMKLKVQKSIAEFVKKHI